MKKLLLITLSALLSWQSASAQTLYEFDADSLEYILPDFSIGTVLFYNGERSQAFLNINTFDNAVRFIDPNTHKDTLIVKNEDEIKAVYIKNRYFAKWQKRYIELVNPTNDTSIGIHRYINVIAKGKVGAYGMASETSSISNLSHINDMGSTYKLKNKSVYDLSYHVDYYICKGNKMYPANTRGFQKIYPKLKAQIPDFVRENDIDFSNPESLKILYEYCIRNQ